MKTLASSISAYGSDALAAWRALPRPERVRLRNFAIWIAVVTVAFAQPRFRLMVHASEQSLHSHILLVPFVAAYMLFTSGSALPAAGRGSIAGALIGALLLTVIKTGCTHVGLPNWVQEILTGTIIVVAMALDRLRERKDG